MVNDAPEDPEQHKLEPGVYDNGIRVVEGWIEQTEESLKKTKPRSTERKFLRRVLVNLKSAKQSLDFVYTAYSNRRKKRRA